jgi:predicted transcriptional regulator
MRERIEIMMEIVEFLYSAGPLPVGVTKIERACGLRDDLCKQYLTELVDRQFVIKNENEEYEITTKGSEFLGDAIELFRRHFPDRRTRIEKDRFWEPKRRIAYRVTESPRTESSSNK